MDTNFCAKCGACSTVCPVYQVTGREELTARGRLHLLGIMASGHRSAAFIEIFSRCLLCGACRQACPRAIDLPALVAETRHNLPRLTGSGSFRKYLANRCLAHPVLLSGLTDLLKLSAPLLRKLPADSGLRLKLGLLLDRQENPGSETVEEPAPEVTHRASDPNEIVIFSGCLAHHLLPEISRAAERLLGAANQSLHLFPEDQTCCGLAAYSTGEREEAARLARRNLDAFASATGPIVTPCGSCYSHLLTYPALLADDPEYHPRALAFAGRLRELSSFLAGDSKLAAKLPRDGTAKTIRIFYHDPCHLRFKPGIREAPRQLLRALPGLKLLELPGGPRCCGLGGTFHLDHPELSHRIGTSLVEQILDQGPDLVLTSCSGCLLQLHQELTRCGAAVPVRHLASFLANP